MRARIPRGAAVGDRDGRAGGRRWSGSASCSPTRSPTRRRASSTTSRATSTTPTTALADLQNWLDRKRHRHRGQAARARPRCRRSASASRGGAGEVVELHPRRGAAPRRGQHRADPDHRPERLHADLRRPDRGGGARASCRRATGRRTTTSRRASRPSLFGYVRGQLLFSLIMGTSAGLMLWVLGSLGIFPEGKTYAIAFGAVVRLRRADPLHRPGHRRASRR